MPVPPTTLTLDFLMHALHHTREHEKKEQFAFTGEKPERIIQSWAQDFCSRNEGWEYRCHSVI